MSAEGTVTVLVALAAAIWLSFLVWYTVRASWWKKPLGRNTFGVSFILFVILVRDTAVHLNPSLHRYAWVGIVVYSVAALLGVQRLVAMEKAQREMVHFKDVK